MRIGAETMLIPRWKGGDEARTKKRQWSGSRKGTREESRKENGTRMLRQWGTWFRKKEPMIGNAYMI